MKFSPVGITRWREHGVFDALIAFAIIAARTFAYVLYSVCVRGEHGPFVGSAILFVASFAGLAISLFPYIVPGQLTVAAARSDSPTLIFMLFGIGTVSPILIAYNLFQYYLSRGKVVAAKH